MWSGEGEVDHHRIVGPTVGHGDNVHDPRARVEANIHTMGKHVNDRVDDAVTFADASPEPPEDWLMTDVYKED